MLFLKLYDDNDNFHAFLFFFLIFSAHGLKILVQKTHQKGVQIHLVVEKIANGNRSCVIFGLHAMYRQL